jgi:hypothetical protein
MVWSQSEAEPRKKAIHPTNMVMSYVPHRRERGCGSCAIYSLPLNGIASPAARLHATNHFSIQPDISVTPGHVLTRITAESPLTDKVPCRTMDLSLRRYKKAAAMSIFGLALAVGAERSSHYDVDWTGDLVQNSIRAPWMREVLGQPVHTTPWSSSSTSRVEYSYFVLSLEGSPSQTDQLQPPPSSCGG